MFLKYESPCQISGCDWFLVVVGFFLDDLEITQAKRAEHSSHLPVGVTRGFTKHSLQSLLNGRFPPHDLWLCFHQFGVGKGCLLICLGAELSGWHCVGVCHTVSVCVCVSVAVSVSVYHRPGT